MTQLKYSDLTPEIMKDLMSLSSSDEVIRYFSEKGFSIGSGFAAKILSQIQKAAGLSDATLSNVAGGDCRYDYDCDWDLTCPSIKRGGAIS